MNGYKTIMGMIDSNRQVTTGLVQEVKALPYEVFVSLVVFCLEIAGVDRVITVGEQATLRQIAGVHLTAEQTKKLFDWFLLKKRADRLFDEVFEDVV